MVGEVVALQTSDEVASELRVFSAENSTATVLVVPAMGVPARKYDGFAQALNQTHINVCIAELRGIESSTVRASRATDFGYKELVTLDLPAALRATKKRFPDQTLTVLGHSLGGQLAALMLAERNQAVGQAENLILNASCSIHYTGWPSPGRFGLLLMTQVANLIAKTLGYFPGRKLNFAGQEAKTVISDWAGTARSGRYVLTDSSFDYEAALKKLNTRVLAINYADDTLAPQPATENLLAKLSSAQISRVALSAEDIEAKRADHFSWMRSPERAAREISGWLAND